jgi:hypothetical protein
MQLEALSNSIESSINNTDRIGLDRSTSKHFRQLLKQFDSKVAVFLSGLQSSQLHDTVTTLGRSLQGNEDHDS